MISVKRPDYIRTAPLKVAIDVAELNNFYKGRERCCLAVAKKGSAFQLIACEFCRDIPYYTAFYSAIDKELIEDPLFPDTLILMNGVVVNSEELPEPEDGQTFLLVCEDPDFNSQFFSYSGVYCSNDITGVQVLAYKKVEHLIAAIESAYNGLDPKVSLNNLTIIMGVEKSMNWKKTIVGQMRTWTKLFGGCCTDLEAVRATEVG